MNKSKKLITITITTFIILIALFAFGRLNIGRENNFVGSVNASSLFSEEKNHDFGPVSMAAGKVQYDFRVKNISKEPVAIEKLYTSCMCTTVNFIQAGKTFGPFGMPGHGAVPALRKTLVSEEEATITVVFDPAAHGPAGVGFIERQVYFESKNDRLLVLQIQANVTP